jgi:hypothetical protein
MIKIVLRLLVILLVVGIVAGGIYLVVQNGGASALGAGVPGAGFERGSGLPGGGAITQGQLPPRGNGDFGRGGHGLEGGMAGFSLAGLPGVMLQVGKIAGITALVVAVQAVLRLFKRRRVTRVAVA